MNPKQNFIEKAIKIHGNKYDYSSVVYASCNKKVTIICKEHGGFLQLPSNHINSKHGCPVCARVESIERCKKRLKNIDDFIRRAIIIHGNSYDYSLFKYINNSTKSVIICKKCESNFFMTPGNHLANKCGCSKCKSSKGEMIIRNWLTMQNIVFEEQKRFSDCRNIRPLPFDFFLPDHNCCIEFDGEQHFKAKSRSADQTNTTKQQNLVKIQKNDKIKNKYCKDKLLNLVRISFNQIKNINDILTNIT